MKTVLNEEMHSIVNCNSTQAAFGWHVREVSLQSASCKHCFYLNFPPKEIHSGWNIRRAHLFCWKDCPALPILSLVTEVAVKAFTKKEPSSVPLHKIFLQKTKILSSPTFFLLDSNSSRRLPIGSHSLSKCVTDHFMCAWNMILIWSGQYLFQPPSSTFSCLLAFSFHLTHLVLLAFC